MFASGAFAANTVLSSESPSPNFTALAASSLGLMAIEQSDSDSIIKQHNVLLPHTESILAAACTSADRVLGLLSGSVGELEQASDHFQVALSFCQKAGYRPEVAWTCCDYADLLLNGIGDGGRSKAISMLDEAMVISSELGMRPLMDRVLALQERAKTLPIAAPPAFPDGLTNREVEVLRLICGGKTDREIGEELFISVKTVGNHVSNILNKTGTANRAEATAYAVRRGLAGDEDSVGE